MLWCSIVHIDKALHRQYSTNLYYRLGVWSILAKILWPRITLNGAKGHQTSNIHIKEGKHGENVHRWRNHGFELRADVRCDQSRHRRGGGFGAQGQRE